MLFKNALFFVFPGQKIRKSNQFTNRKPEQNGQEAHPIEGGKQLFGGEVSHCFENVAQ